MLQELQQWIERTYRLEMAGDLSPFLIGTGELRHFLKPDDPLRKAEEVVIFTESGGECFLGLYLEPHFLSKRMGKGTRRLHRLLTSLEGISHLRLMMHRLKAEQALTRLELELQAEVDKFLFLRMHKPNEDAGYHLRLESSLPGLSEEQRELYADALKLANRYCRRLERNFLSTRSQDGLRRELGAFYRMSHWEKLNHLGTP